ncbi:MAG: STN domain-containing protein [Proteobacteria bacterium]|nr:STN domain-containing protein [Pseudomonadota bacterium]
MPSVHCVAAAAVAAWLAFAGASALAAPLDESAHLSIPAAPLSDALRSLARQVDLQILFDPELVAGIRSRAIDAWLTPRAALATLLRGSALEARASGANVIVIRKAVAPPGNARPRPAPATANDSDAGALGEIIVTSQRRAERMRDVPLSVSA